MSSFVFYRFKSQKEPSRISFDGTGISVWDLKKEIIMENKMGKGTDFDFAIYHADTEEEYTDDYATVPRSTSVLARRLPPSRPGRGTAQKYMPNDNGAGLAPGPAGRPGMGGPGQSGWNSAQFSKRFDGGGGRGGDYQHEQQQMTSANQAPVQVTLPAAAPQDEANALAAMFAASSQQWQQTQEQMANATPIYRAPQRAGARPGAAGAGAAGGASSNPSGGGFRPGMMASGEHKPPPLGYICYRCGQKGHWIQECPTNSDPAFNDRPRIKRTTGIPKSFLTTVEGPQAAAGGETQAGASGVMVTAEGGFVVARPDSESWLAHRALTKNLTATDVQNLAPTDPDLTCPICSRLLRDAVQTPCCSTAFCDECITNALADNDMLCPECETRVKSIEKLKVDDGRRERVKRYIEETVEASKDEEELAAEAKAKAEAEAEAAAAEEEANKVKTEGDAEATVTAGTDIKKEGEASAETAVKVEEDGDKKPESDVKPVSSDSSATVEIAATSIPAPSASIPTPTNLSPAQQAQMARQQQLRAQQAQAMAAMQQRQQQQQQGVMAATVGNGGMGGGGGGGMNPMIAMQMQQLQMQGMQLQMTLSNPMLPAPMRAQCAQQLQRVQLQMQQYMHTVGMGMNMGMGMGMNMGMGMGMGTGMGPGMNMGMGMGSMGMQQGQQSPMQHQQQQNGGNMNMSNVPTGPRAQQQQQQQATAVNGGTASTNGSGSGVKRERTAEPGNASPSATAAATAEAGEGEGSPAAKKRLVGESVAA